MSAALNAVELREEKLVATGVRCVADALRHGARQSIDNAATQLAQIERELREPPMTFSQRLSLAQRLCRIASRVVLANRRAAIDIWLLTADYYYLVLRATSSAAIVLERAANNACQTSLAQGLLLLTESSKMFERCLMFERALVIEQAIVDKARREQQRQYTQRHDAVLAKVDWLSENDVEDDDDDDVASLTDLALLRRTARQSDLLATERACSSPHSAAEHILMLQDANGSLVCDQHWFEKRRARIDALRDRVALQQEQCYLHDDESTDAAFCHVWTSVDGIGHENTSQK